MQVDVFFGETFEYSQMFFVNIKIMENKSTIIKCKKCSCLLIFNTAFLIAIAKRKKTSIIKYIQKYYTIRITYSKHFF